MSYDQMNQSPLRPLVAVTEREQAAKTATRWAATRMVADRATGVDDCARLLDMLGLHPREGLAVTKTETFHIGDLLTAYTGMLLSPSGFDGTLKILSHLTGDEIMHHQVPAAIDAVHESLVRQHPWLADVTIPKFDGETAKAWLEEVAVERGQQHPVTAVPQTWGQHDPIADLLDMNPNARVIGIAVPETDPTP